MTTSGPDPCPGDADELAPQVPDPPALPPRPDNPRHIASATKPPPVPPATPEPLPEYLGRYRVIAALGKGGQGRVFRAHDPKLKRDVAIKVTLARGLSNSAYEALLREAEILAGLEHPHILPVYDVGEIPVENPGLVSAPADLFVVSPLVEGSDLASRLKRDPPLTLEQALDIVAAIADALAHAHARGLVHRDVKPANILIDKAGTPYLADFGLALRETDRSRGSAGTPAYMSPEQAANRGHLVKAQSDIYSLGVVLYELLTGRLPFIAKSQDELLAKIQNEPVENPRQYRDTIPGEIARICMKALENKRSDRYDVARDFANEIRLYLAQNRLAATSQWVQAPVSKPFAGQNPGVSPVPGNTPPVTAADAAIAISPPADSGPNGPTQVVPKGLRSFEAADAGFFLDLLPGPFDRDGLPASIRFWKSRVEEPNPGRVFRAGVIYGPSGCGKSSLVKAGLLPRLARSVTAIYREATPADTEAELARDIRRALPAARGETLAELLADTRRRELAGPGGRLLIVLDQFEQWLHASADYARAPLTLALQQTDGKSIAALLMVRGDFWPSITRFMRELEIPMRDDDNCRMVDRFTTSHARHVLTLFGKALGQLPASDADFSADQRQFLDRAVAGLADEDSRVVPVRLAVFAEMTKNRPWTPETLAQVGGVEGVGFTFLDENFGPRHAPISHRPHLQAVQPLLAALLPAAGADLKGVRKTAAELRQAAGYENRPGDFGELTRILDTDLRLITPVDPVDPADLARPQAGFEPGAAQPAASGELFMNSPTIVPLETTASMDHSAPAAAAPAVPPALQNPRDSVRYQLTHDFLVPSLRQWLDFQKAGTRTGRAWLKLESRSAVWSATPENRQLPSLTEWLSIRLRTQSHRWTETQRAMMRRAGRVHVARSVLGLSMLGLLAFAGWELRQTTRAQGAVRNLLTVAPAELPAIVSQIDSDYARARGFLTPVLAMAATTPEDKRNALHARLASVGHDRSLVEPLAEELLTAKEPYIQPIRDILKPFAAELAGKFKAVLHDDAADAPRRFRAGIALAGWRPEPGTFTTADFASLAAGLVNANAEFQPVLRNALRPVQAELLPHLKTIFTDAKAGDAARFGAANAFADYASADIARLADLIASADPRQFAVLYPLVAESQDPARITVLANIVASPPPDTLGTVDRIGFGQRRANAAATLLRLGERAKVLPVFEVADDPEALTQFVFRCRDRGVAAGELLELFRLVNTGGMKIDRKQNLAQYALLLALGEYRLDEIPEPARDGLIRDLGTIYRGHPASGVHGACGWLLRHWGKPEIVKAVDETPVPYQPGREWYTLAIQVRPDRQNLLIVPAPKTFHYTFVVFPAGDHLIGSPDDEPERSDDERRHAVRISRPFAILNRELTFAELIAFQQTHLGFMNDAQIRSAPDRAAQAVNWIDSVNFCRWLGEQMKLPEADQPYPALNPRASALPRDWAADLAKKGFRLPTEAEWEIAARAGSRAAFGFGSDAGLLPRFGWFVDNSEKRAHAPAELRPNARGLFDMHGNMFEWTHDGYEDYPEGKAIDPSGSTEAAFRVLRGGGWRSNGGNCRAARRNWDSPGYRFGNFGFRLAAVPEQENQ